MGLALPISNHVDESRIKRDDELAMLEGLFWDAIYKDIELILDARKIYSKLQSHKCSELESRQIEIFAQKIWIHKNYRGFVIDKHKEGPTRRDNICVVAHEILDSWDITIAEILMSQWVSQIKQRYWDLVLFWCWWHTLWDLHDYLGSKQTEELMSKTFWFANCISDYVLLRKARIALKSEHRVEDIKTCLRLYSFFKSLPNQVKDMNVSNYIKDSSEYEIEYVSTTNTASRWFVYKWSWFDVDTNRNNITSRVDILHELIEDDNTQKNRLRSIDWRWRRYNVYLDSPSWILLKHKWLPIAKIWFSIKDFDTLFINQMQQVSFEVYDKAWRCMWHNVDEASKKTKWQEILYRILCDIAKNECFKHVEIQSWANNAWTKTYKWEYDFDFYWNVVTVSTEIPCLSLEIAKKMYDDFAMKHQFSRETSTSNWRKEL